jgi:hypothetical protein
MALNKPSTMKHLKTLTLFFLTIFVISCSDSDDNSTPTDELAGLQLVTTLQNDSHDISLYTADGTLQTGYNLIAMQIKDADGNPISNASITWNPVMHMMSMDHSCPKSAVAKKQNADFTYEGFIVFQMAGNDMESWELTVNYTINGTSYTASSTIDVAASPKRRVESFQATDGNRYVVAMIEPMAPKVGINDMTAVVYQMESMMGFIPIEGYLVKIDPRMPGMGNHGSPNNVDLVSIADGFYQGKLSLTMTGYWKVNLQLVDAGSTVIYGNEVTEDSPGSNIYFEVEF